MLFDYNAFGNQHLMFTPKQITYIWITYNVKLIKFSRIEQKQTKHVDLLTKKKPYDEKPSRVWKFRNVQTRIIHFNIIFSCCINTFFPSWKKALSDFVTPFRISRAEKGRKQTRCSVLNVLLILFSIYFLYVFRPSFTPDICIFPCDLIGTFNVAQY